MLYSYVLLEAWFLENSYVSGLFLGTLIFRLNDPVIMLLPVLQI